MKLKLGFIITSLLLVLSACGDGEEVVILEENTEVVNTDVSNTKENFIVQVAEFDTIVKDFYKEVDPLFQTYGELSTSNHNYYKLKIKDSMVALKEVEINPITKEDHIIYDQVLTVMYYFESMQDSALKYLLSGRDIAPRRLYTDYKENVSFEHEKLRTLILNFN